MFFDNSLLRDHTGYILAIIVVFLQSAHLEKDEAVGFSLVFLFLFFFFFVSFWTKLWSIFAFRPTNQPNRSGVTWVSCRRLTWIRISLGTKDCFLPFLLLDSVGWELSARGTKHCVWVFCCDQHSAKIPRSVEDNPAFWNQTMSEETEGCGGGTGVCCRWFPKGPMVWVTRALPFVTGRQRAPHWTQVEIFLFYIGSVSRSHALGIRGGFCVLPSTAVLHGAETKREVEGNRGNKNHWEKQHSSRNKESSLVRTLQALLYKVLHPVALFCSISYLMLMGTIITFDY